MKNMVATQMLPENLVALVYSSNCCYTTVADQAIEGLTIDLKERTWNYQHPKDQFKNTRTQKIGECDYSVRTRNSGVIGIYDRTITEHLSWMVRHSQEMTSSDRESFDD